MRRGREKQEGEQEKKGKRARKWEKKRDTNLFTFPFYLHAVDSLAGDAPSCITN